MTFISAIVSDIISFPNDDALMKLFNLAEMDRAFKGQLIDSHEGN